MATVVHLDGEKVCLNKTGKQRDDNLGPAVEEIVECPRKGTLNGEKIARSELQQGDEIAFGPSHFAATRK